MFKLKNDVPGKTTQDRVTQNIREFVSATARQRDSFILFPEIMVGLTAIALIFPPNDIMPDEIDSMIDSNLSVDE